MQAQNLPEISFRTTGRARRNPVQLGLAELALLLSASGA